MERLIGRTIEGVGAEMDEIGNQELVLYFRDGSTARIVSEADWPTPPISFSVRVTE